MDTHISDFRKTTHVYVMINNISGFLIATDLTGKTNKNVISHCLHYYSMLGIPDKVKTDNGTGYYSQAFEMFCQQFNITHITGIPYNSQGQDIVEL
jgi:transposase InsO family protein